MKLITLDDTKKKKKPEITICTECSSFIDLEPNSPRRNVWDNAFCKANPLSIEIDPFDGEKKPFSFNDLGMKYFSKNKYDFCRNHNDGNCPDYTSK